MGERTYRYGSTACTPLAPLTAIERPVRYTAKILKSFLYALNIGICNDMENLKVIVRLEVGCCCCNKQAGAGEV